MPPGAKDLVGLKDEYVDKFHRHVPEAKDTIPSSSAQLHGGKSVTSSGWVLSLRHLLHSMLK